MSAKPVLKLDWCSHAAAKYAVEHWHYSRRMPKSKLGRCGVWEESRFVGVVIFGVGASNNLGKPYRLDQTQVCELVRIALTQHKTPTSRIVAIAVRLLSQGMAGLRLIVSFADQNAGHTGVLYQACGWLYAGEAAADRVVYGADGKPRHPRAHRLKYQTETGFRRRRTLPKHRYLYPLDAAMRAQIAPLAQPYPKRATSILADAPTDQAGESGAAPTVALAAVDG
jgi:hypothetical protein